MNNLSRVVSALCALATVATILFAPRAIAVDGAHVAFGFYVALLAGASLACVHAFGFRSGLNWLDRILSPLAAWPLLALGAWGIFLR